MNRKNTGGMGLRIQKKRKEKRLRQYELAEAVGITNNHLSAIENGTEKPSLETLIKICNRLDVTPDEILLGSIHPKNVPENVLDSLKLCSEEDVNLCREFVELLVRRNKK